VLSQCVLQPQILRARALGEHAQGLRRAVGRPCQIPPAGPAAEEGRETPGSESGAGGGATREGTYTTEIRGENEDCLPENAAQEWRLPKSQLGGAFPFFSSLPLLPLLTCECPAAAPLLPSSVRELCLPAGFCHPAFLEGPVVPPPRPGPPPLGQPGATRLRASKSAAPGLAAPAGGMGLVPA
jgi:hypothetical protein